MLSEFEGEDGKRKLIARLERQEMVRGDGALAALLADAVELAELPSGATLVERDGEDTNLFFILDGAAAVLVNGNVIALREQHQHVGELALIDPTATRSASVVARGPALVAKLSEAQFSEIADHHPALWRGLAIELGSRLRRRNVEVRLPNPTPIVFIGCSADALDIAGALQDALDTGDIIPRLWTSGGLYGEARFAIDSFVHQVASSDVAVLVMGHTAASGDRPDTALYDALFDVGLFMGSLGKERTMIVRPKSLQVTVPTDRLGFSTVTYSSEHGQDAGQIAETAAALIRRRIGMLGAR